MAPTRWQYSSRLVSTVFERRVALKELFEHILKHHDEYDKDSVRCANRYNSHLDYFMYNSVWQEWMSFVTQLRGREGDFVRYMSLLFAKQKR